MTDPEQDTSGDPDSDTSDDSARKAADDSPSLPVTPNGAWSTAETVAFLAETTVPIRLACRTPAGGLWMLSLWYQLAEGALWCATARDADVVSYLESDSQVAFEISVNEPPYMGVRGQGSVSIQPDDDKEVLRDLIHRYLGDTDSSLARYLLSPDRQEVALRIEPTKLYTWDYSDRMDDTVE